MGVFLLDNLYAGFRTGKQSERSGGESIKYWEDRTKIADVNALYRGSKGVSG